MKDTIEVEIGVSGENSISEKEMNEITEELIKDPEVLSAFKELENALKVANEEARAAGKDTNYSISMKKGKHGNLEIRIG